ncbi:WD40 repeat domain-containing protein [Tessaracoccus sp. OH4464_COT-324]|uniref:WD40 repeat domain-containing protein n=1 Tax=Tessaracoccus sp. OH4464_COT-324 TaxID=2491059 RepID=UPI000F63070B|nr:hypothetical protein [Tessaracoccus sp. OH4464_COT-324]RRD46740.1 hypothetical protein EII42_05810 [Tessaracoccus sp. OH4464_COT-324]
MTACSLGDESASPPPHGSSCSVAEPPRCVSLETHDFSAPYECGAQHSDQDRTPPTWYGHQLLLGDGVLTAYYRNAIVEWDLTTRKPTRLLGAAHTAPGAFTRTPSHTVAATTDGRLAVHDQNGCLTGYLTGHPVSPHKTGTESLCALPDGRVASTGQDGWVCVWDVANLRPTGRLQLPVGGPSSGLHWSATRHQLVVTATQGRDIFFLDPDPLVVHSAHSGLPFINEAWLPLPDGQFAACGSGNGIDGLLLLDSNLDFHRVTFANYDRLRAAESGAFALTSKDATLLFDGDVVREPPTRELQNDPPDFALAPDGGTAYVLRRTEPILEVDLSTGETHEFATPGE